MIRYTCPSPDRWTALLREDLSDGEQHDLEAHLDECPDCQRVLETCAADRSAWAAVPRWLATSAESDAPLKTVIERLKNSPDDEAEATDMTLDFLDPSDQSGSLGRLGQYEILGEIGRGGMGVVLKALDPALHRVVAIKVLAPPLALSASYRKRFTREARAAAAVCHEHVVTIHAVEEFKSLPYLVMQYVAGQSLQQKLDSCGPLPVADILRIGTQAAAGLAAAHAQGLVHRDIKPGNILLENGVERVRITDFGLARTIDDVGVTSSGVITGTPQYMAPEQARGQTVDARADLFSLGSVLYAMCTGEAPFHGSHALDVLRKVAEDQPQPIRELNYAIPPWLDAIVMKLMAKDPAQRYQSSSEVAELLERCLAHVQSPNTVSLPPTIHCFAQTRPSRISRWAALVLPILAGLFVVSEGTGATHIIKSLGTILRFRTPEGTLVVEVDDPAVKVTLDDKDLVITGAGAQEVRLKVGSHTLRATKDGQTKSEIVSIEKDGKATVKVSFEADGGPRPSPKAVAAEKKYTVEFREEPWTNVFDSLSKLTGLPVVRSGQTPEGKYSLTPKRDSTITELIDLIDDTLIEQRFMLVRKPSELLLVRGGKLHRELYRNVGTDELTSLPRWDLVHISYQLQTLDARNFGTKASHAINGLTVFGAFSFPDSTNLVQFYGPAGILVKVIESLREADTPPKSPPSAPKNSDERKFSVEFRDQPWGKVFEWLGEISGLPVIANTNPTGSFTFNPPLKHSRPLQLSLIEVIDILNDALMQQHFLIVRLRNTFKLVPTDEKIDPSLFTRVSVNDLDKHGKTELVGVMYRPTKTPIDAAVGLIEKMRGPSGMTISVPGSSSVLICDTAQNVQQIVRVLDELENGPLGGAFDPNAKRGTSKVQTPGGNKPLSGPPASTKTDVKFSETFPNEPWPDVLDRLSKLAGVPVIAPIKPPGSFLDKSPPLQSLHFQDRTIDEILDTFNTLLRDRQFFLVRRPDKIELFSIDKKPDPASFTSVSIEELARRRKTELVALDFQLTRLKAADAAEIVTGFNGPLGSSSGDNRTNRILIRDTTDHVLWIVRVLTEMDRGPTEGAADRNAKPGAPGEPASGGDNGAALGPKSPTFGLLAADAPVALVMSQSKLEVWDTATSQTRQRIDLPSPAGDRRGQSAIPHFAISSDGKRVAMTVLDMLYVWDAATGNSFRGSTAQCGDITAVAFGAKGKLIATAGTKYAQVKVWDVDTNKEIRTFGRFTIPVSVLAFSPDGSKLLMSDGTIARVYDLVTGAEIDDRIPIGAQVSAAAFTADGQIVALAGRTILVWKPEKDAKVQQIDAGIDLTALALTPDRRRVLVGKSSGEVELWDLSKGQYIWALAGYGPHPVRSLSVAPNGRSYTVIGATPDGSMVIRTESDDVADTGLPPPTAGAGSNQQPTGGAPTKPNPTDPKFSPSFPPSSWADFFDRLSKLAGLPVIAPIKPEGNFFGITPPLLQGGRPLEYTLDDLLDTVNSLLSRERFFLARRPDKIELFPTDQRLDPAKFTSVSLDELARRRKTDLVALDFQLKYTVAAYAAEFLKPFHGPLGSSNGTNRTNRVLIRDTADRVQSIVRVLNELERKTKEGGINRNSEPAIPGGPGKDTAANKKAAGFGILAADAPVALVVTDEGIEIRNVATSESRAKIQIRVLTSDRDKNDVAPKVAISADGRRIAVARANVLTIYDGETGKKIKDLNAHGGDIAAVTFGSNGKLVATSGKTDGRVRIWDVSSLSELRRFHDFPTPATVLAFSPDGRRFLANNGSVIQTLSIANGEEIDCRIPIGAQVSAAAFNSQGQVVALVGRTILTWKPEKNAKVRQIDTNINLTAMALTPDGQRVLVGGRNGELALFRLMDGQLIRPMSVPGPVQSLSIAPDGQSYSVITETRDGRQLIGQSAAMLSESITPPPTNPR